VDTDNTQEPQEISSEEEAELEKFVLSLLEDQPAEATRGPLDLLANVLTGLPAVVGAPPDTEPAIAPAPETAPTEAGAIDESRMDLAELLDSPDMVSNLANLLKEKLKIPAIVAVPMAEYILKSLKRKKARRKPRKAAASTAKKKTTARKKTSTTAKKKPAVTAKKKTTAKKTTTKKKASAATKPTAAAKKKTAANKQAATAKKSAATAKKTTAKKKTSSSRTETVDVAES
jgi:hypothetical protein